MPNKSVLIGAVLLPGTALAANAQQQYQPYAYPTSRTLITRCPPFPGRLELQSLYQRHDGIPAMRTPRSAVRRDIVSDLRTTQLTPPLATPSGRPR